ncbi:hypothetical protein CCACVL1_01476, partial [Corchorus capsularis]
FVEAKMINNNVKLGLELVRLKLFSLTIEDDNL